MLIDYGGTFGTNQVIVNTGTQNLDSTTMNNINLQLTTRWRVCLC